MADFYTQKLKAMSLINQLIDKGQNTEDDIEFGVMLHMGMSKSFAHKFISDLLARDFCVIDENKKVCRPKGYIRPKTMEEEKYEELQRWIKAHPGGVEAWQKEIDEITAKARIHVRE